MAEDFLNVSDENFEEIVLKSELPVLVDFWAAWCAPCQMIVPALENIAKTYQEKMKVAKVNVDENMKIPSKYGIMSIPTLLLFKGGEVKETIIGALSQDKIIDTISKHI
ncbi:thioredoxin [Acidobacteriota bacterium]